MPFPHLLHNPIGVGPDGHPRAQFPRLGRPIHLKPGGWCGVCMSDAFVDAMNGVLDDSLSVAKFSQLRATSWDGTDHQLSEHLCKATQTRIAVGQVQCTLKQCQRLTGEYLARRPFNPERDSPLDRGKVKEYRTTSTATPRGGSIEPIYDTWTEQHLTPEQARQLYKIDPDNWGEGALKWAGIDTGEIGATSPQTSVTHKSSNAPSVDAQALRICEQLGIGYDDLRKKDKIITPGVLASLKALGIEEVAITSTMGNIDKTLVEHKGRHGMYKTGPVIAYLLAHCHRPTRPQPVGAMSKKR